MYLCADTVRGGSTDWYLEKLGVRFPYTVELSPTVEDYLIGFKLPPERIRSVGEEIWAALQVVLKKIIELS